MRKSYGCANDGERFEMKSIAADQRGPDGMFEVQRQLVPIGRLEEPDHRDGRGHPIKQAWRPSGSRRN